VLGTLSNAGRVELGGCRAKALRHGSVDQDVDVADLAPDSHCTSAGSPRSAARKLGLAASGLDLWTVSAPCGVGAVNEDLGAIPSQLQRDGATETEVAPVTSARCPSQVCLSAPDLGFPRLSFS